MATSTLEANATATGSRALESRALRDASDFEHVYRDARGQIARIPWATGESHAALVAWLNSEGPCHVRPGCRVAVVGCGLGDDAIEFLNRGFDVVAFDAAPTAIEWAMHRHSSHASSFMCADVCEAPSRWRHRFDLVVDVNNLPWIEESRREDYASSVAELLHPNGAMLMICGGTDSEELAGDSDDPAVSAPNLLDLVRSFGLTPSRELDDFTDDADPPRRWLRGCFRFNR